MAKKMFGSHVHVVKDRHHIRDSDIHQRDVLVAEERAITLRKLISEKLGREVTTRAQVEELLNQYEDMKTRGLVR